MTCIHECFSVLSGIHTMELQPSVTGTTIREHLAVYPGLVDDDVREPSGMWYLAPDISATMYKIYQQKTILVGYSYKFYK